MKVLRRVSASSASVLGYVLLLMAFVALGLFTAALATDGGVASAILGIGLTASLAGSVMGFRLASRKLAQSGAEATSPVSIFSTPLRQDQIDRYLENYGVENRSAAPPRTIDVINGDDSVRRSITEHRDPALLAA